MERKLELKALVPDRAVLETTADFVLVRTLEGELGILPGHEPYLAQLAPEGTLCAHSAGKITHTLKVFGGYVSVKNNQVVVLSPLADYPDRVDAALEAVERQRSAKKAEDEKAALEIQRAEGALRRTLVKSERNTSTILNEKEEARDEPQKKE